MKRSRQVGWQRSAFGTAAIMALSLTLGLAPRATRADDCTGDCNTSGAVTQDELLTLTDIALGNVTAAACAGSTNDTTVVDIVRAAGTSCVPTGPNLCGNGAVDAGEDCDNGGICTGGVDTGKACTSETDCAGNIGRCNGGTKYFNACAGDDGCPGGKCIKCTTFGGSGCAANCTTETAVTLNLVPGVKQGLDCKPETSCAIPHGDVLTLPLPLTGTQVLTIGKQSPDGTIPVVSPSASVSFPRIPVSSIACACLRGVSAKTCGATLYDIDGLTLSKDCTPEFTAGDSVCASAGLSPCYFLHGPGNAASGVIGCGAGGYSPVDVVFDQDSGGETGTEGKPIITLSGSGPPGSVLLLSNNAIGTTTGACTGSDSSKYGVDGQFCTDDDPQDQRGDPSPQMLVTGTAIGKIEGANDTDGDDLGTNSQCEDAGVPDACCTGQQTGTCGFSVVGNPLVCENLLQSQNVAGAALAAAFVQLDSDVLLDIIVTSKLVGQ